MENKYNKYNEFQYDKLIGKPLYSVEKASHGKYVIKDQYLARNSEGMLGFIGRGITWFLAQITETGPYAFNPIEENEIVWLPLHRGYCRKRDLEHFEFPFVLGEHYTIEDGKKCLPWIGEVSKINYPKYI